MVIPKFNLEAEINEGIDEATLNQYIGHFPQSGINCGNIALAAHNRGYKVNYFSRIKELTSGDEIIYRVNGVEQKYIVYENSIIQDTDVYVIENTKEDIITLITCVENKPQLRRCIKGRKIIN